jgi:hypothetical protein
MAQQTAAQPAKTEYYRIQKRPWYAWVLWILWAAVLVFLVQNAITSSGSELEPRAAMLFWVSAGVVALAGIVIAFVRRGR